MVVLWCYSGSRGSGGSFYPSPPPLPPPHSPQAPGLLMSEPAVWSVAVNINNNFLVLC